MLTGCKILARSPINRTDGRARACTDRTGFLAGDLCGADRLGALAGPLRPDPDLGAWLGPIDELDCRRRRAGAGSAGRAGRGGVARPRLGPAGCRHHPDSRGHSSRVRGERGLHGHDPLDVPDRGRPHARHRRPAGGLRAAAGVAGAGAGGPHARHRRARRSAGRHGGGTVRHPARAAVRGRAPGDPAAPDRSRHPAASVGRQRAVRGVRARRAQSDVLGAATRSRTAGAGRASGGCLDLLPVSAPVERRPLGGVDDAFTRRSRHRPVDADRRRRAARDRARPAATARR